MREVILSESPSQILFRPSESLLHPVGSHSSDELNPKTGVIPQYFKYAII